MTKEAIRFQFAAFSCSVELRATTSLIFSPKLGYFADFLERGAVKLRREAGHSAAF
jgi:hypothetical protein